MSEAGPPTPGRSGVTWRELVAVASLLLLLGVVFTWPLSRHLTTDILYTHEAPPGYERVSLTQGDHLQLIYCYWLFGDSVRSGRSLVEDSYQFRDGRPPGFFFQPSLLPLLTLLLSPLGLVAAYNLLLLFSFVGAGLAMHLLLRLEIDDPWAALAGALVAALLPFRVMQLATHANGFLSFLIPLYLYFFERSLRGPRRWGWIVAAGVTVFFAGAMEFHIIYYLLLFLGLYLPFRFVAPLDDWLERQPEPPPERHLLAPALLAGLGGAGAGIAAYHAADRVHHFNDPAGWVVTAAVCAGATLLLWRALTRVAHAHLEPQAGGFALLVARPFAPLALLALGPLGSRLAIPQFGRVLAAVAVAGAVILAIPLVRLASRATLRARGRALLVDRGQRYLAHLAFLGVTVGYLLVVRARVFAPSTVGKGRLFTDVTAFSPRPEDLLAAVNPHSERFAYIGIVTLLLAVVGALAVRRLADPGRRSRLVFLALAGIGGYVLAIGPHLGRFPAYHLLFQYLPLFNSPRVSGRILHIAVLGLAALAALGLAGVRGWAGRRAGAVTLVALALLTADYLPRRAPGLTTLPASHPVYDRLALERRPDETILELPLWPGDTAWSSIYLWYVTRYRNRLLNGYSPAVPRDYAARVFQPLYPLDLGEMRRPQYDLLRRLGIRFIVFHEEAYPPQVSQFPVRVATESLSRSPYLETVVSEPPLWLFRLREIPPASEPAFAVTSPIGSLWEGEQALAQPGERRADPLASDGAVAAYPAGRSGILNRPVPRRVYPTGSYRVAARFLPADGQQLPGLGLTVKHAESGSPLVAAALAPVGGGAGGADLEATFALAEPTPVFVELTSDGSSAVSWDYLLLTFAAEHEPRLAWEIEDLWHMGRTIADPEASGGQAVQLDPERDPRDFAISGPNRVLPAGSWVATLRFKGRPDAAPAAGERFEVAIAGPAAAPLATAPLPPASQPGYQEVSLPFRVERSAPVRLRVFFPGGRRLVLDRVVIAPG